MVLESALCRRKGVHIGKQMREVMKWVLLGGIVTVQN